MTVDVQLTGMKELNKALKQLEGKVSASIARKALGKGAREVRDEIKRRVPVNTGNLRRSIAVATKKLGRTGFVAHVGPAKRTNRRRNKDTGKLETIGVTDGWYAHLVEYGTAPHRIPKRGNKPLKINGRIVRGPVQHPGTPPRPFMRPAWAASKGRLVRIVGQEAWRLIEREARK